MRAAFVGFVALLLAACAAPETSVEVRPLVDAAWLNENLDAVVVLDIRGPQANPGYQTGHIPGSVNSPYGQDPWRVTRDGVPGMSPPVMDLEPMLGRLGISNLDHVVIVTLGESAAEFGSATRVYWQLKVLGHERLSILNGGYRAWQTAGYSVEREMRQPEPATYRADYQPQLVAGAEQVLAAIESGTPLIDARDRRYYLGERKIRVAARYGTIAGARNVPTESYTVDGGGVFIDSATAAALWSEAGVPTEGEQITFCNTGHLASLAWFTAYELLGNKQARLYDGSIAEWSANPALPMERTDNPDRLE
jgi:thiosulfate/3-mercaptopyruvate sulfurtransferase